MRQGLRQLFEADGNFPRGGSGSVLFLWDGYGRGRTRALMRAMTHVLDRARPERPAFPAPIPDWVPASIAQHARNSLQSPALVRLRDRSAYALGLDPISPANIALPTDICSQRGCPFSGAQKPRPRAARIPPCWRLFRSRPGACRSAAAHHAPTRKLETRESGARTIAPQTVGRSRYAGLPGRAWRERTGLGKKALGTAADVLWHMSSKAPVGDIIVGDCGEREVQAVTMTIAGACCWLFGSPPCGNCHTDRGRTRLPRDRA